MRVIECLSSDQLKSYALGQLEDDLAEQVARHLTDCPACDETLAGFDDTNDSLLLHIKTSQSDDEESPVLDAALQGIAELKSGKTDVRSESSADDWVRDYQLVEQLGQGGMGTVYKAVHQKLQRTVAIKLLPARRLSNSDAVARFQREMRAIGRLDHPAIVRATDAGEFEGTHFLAMDFVDGIDLSKVVRFTGPLSIPDACEVIRVTATGLDYAHQQGLIHRDVKPSNIMLACAEDGTVSVKLLDLGLALFGAASEAVDDFTTVGQLMGTLDYMAPEQADHSKVTATADVYSLAATLFKLLTGRAPFETSQPQNPLQKMKVLATSKAPSLKERQPDAPADLVAVVDQLLQQDPNDRPQTAAEVASAIKPFCDGHQLRKVADEAIEKQTEARRIEEQAAENRGEESLAMPSKPGVAAIAAPSFQPSENGASGGDRSHWKRWLAGFAAVPLLAALGFLIWVQTDNGTLKIESVADDIPIKIRQGDTVVKTLTLSTGPNEVKLRSGSHEILLSTEFDTVQLSKQKVEIERGGQTVVRIERVDSKDDSLHTLQQTAAQQSPAKTVAENPHSDVTPAEWLADYDRATYRVGPGDLLAVQVQHMTSDTWLPASRDKRLPPAKGCPMLILDDGELHMPCLSISVDSLTVAEIEKTLHDAYIKNNIVREGTTVEVNVLERRTAASETFVNRYRSSVGDTLAIAFQTPLRKSAPTPDQRLYTDTLDLPACVLGGLYTIDSSGNIDVPKMKPVNVAELSPSGIRQAITDAYVERQIYHEDSFSINVGFVSGKSSAWFMYTSPSPKNSEIAPRFEGRTYAEWTAILDQERSVRKLIKPIEALAELSGDSNSAETCESILKAMELIHPDSFKLSSVSLESSVLQTGIRCIRELSPSKTLPVLQKALQTHSSDICNVIIGELCCDHSDSRAIVKARPNSGRVEPLRKVLMKSDDFVDAVCRSFPRWGIESTRGRLSDHSAAVVHQLIFVRRSAGKELTPAMLEFCRTVIEEEQRSEGIIAADIWRLSIFVLLETTDQEDLPESLWEKMTNENWGWGHCWASLPSSPVVIRKMVPIMEKGIRAFDPNATVLTDLRSPSMFSSLAEPRFFFESTLMVEAIGLAGKDAASCVGKLSEQIQQYTGVSPTPDGIYTFNPADHKVCAKLDSSRLTNPNVSSRNEAVSQHVKTLLLAWEQITGEAPKFDVTAFPKLAELPRQLRPQVLTYKSKTVAEWAQFDGEGFVSWENERQRLLFLKSLKRKGEQWHEVQNARERIAEFALTEFHDDPAWFELVHEVLLECRIEKRAAEHFSRMLESLTVEQANELLQKSTIVMTPIATKDTTIEIDGLSTYQVSLSFPFEDVPSRGGDRFKPLPAAVAAFSRLVNGLDQLPLQDRRLAMRALVGLIDVDELGPGAEVKISYLMNPQSETLREHVEGRRGWASAESLGNDDSKLRVLATLAAAARLPYGNQNRDDVIDGLLQIIERSSDDNANWVNAAVTLAPILKRKSTVDEVQRLLKNVEDESSSECFDVLWRKQSAEGPDGPTFANEIMPVSRRLLVLQLLTIAARAQEEKFPDLTPKGDGEADPLQAVRELASPITAALAPLESLIPDKYGYRLYVESVRPSVSHDHDQDAVAHWASQLLTAVGQPQ